MLHRSVRGYTEGERTTALERFSASVELMESTDALMRVAHIHYLQQNYCAGVLLTLRRLQKRDDWAV